MTDPRITKEMIEMLAKRMADTASDWLHSNCGDDEHWLEHSNWEAYTEDAKHALEAVFALLPEPYPMENLRVPARPVHDHREEGAVMDDWECWVAYYSDYSGIAVFGTEIEALRFAVVRGMQVERFESGGEVR